jgi:hypothetical protein
MSRTALGVLVVLVVIAAGMLWFSQTPREGFFWEDFGRPSARENFSPDVPGSCLLGSAPWGGTSRCGKMDRAAAIEFDALRILAGSR